MDNECSTKASAFQGPPTLQPFRLAEHDLIKAEHQSGPRVGRFTPVCTIIRQRFACSTGTRRVDETCEVQTNPSKPHTPLTAEAYSPVWSPVGWRLKHRSRPQAGLPHACQHMSAN